MDSDGLSHGSGFLENLVIFTAGNDCVKNPRPQRLGENGENGAAKWHREAGAPGNEGLKTWEKLSTSG